MQQEDRGTTVDETTHRDDTLREMKNEDPFKSLEQSALNSKRSEFLR